MALSSVAGKDVHRARSLPQEFRDDVVRVARNREPGQKLAQIAKDFGTSESCLTNWMRQADVEDGARPGTTREESSELRDLRRRNRLLEQENEVLHRAAAYLSQANQTNGSVCPFPYTVPPLSRNSRDFSAMPSWAIRSWEAASP